MKTCRACLQLKPFDGFHRNTRGKDGYCNVCKPCACAKTRAWASDNPDRVRQMSRRAYEANPDRFKAQAKRWGAANRARRREIVRKWDERHIEQKRNKNRVLAATKYYADIEASRAAVRRNATLYRQRHPEIVKARAQRARRRRRAEALAVPVGRVDFERIKVRDRMRCHLCKRRVTEKDLNFDHVIPLAKGGAHTEDNIAVSHRRCNQAKGAKVTSLF